jgi:hypothetical protein
MEPERRNRGSCGFDRDVQRPLRWNNERYGLFSSAIILNVEIAAFTIEFPEHLPAEKRQYCLDHLANTGAEVELHTDLIFRVLCSKPNQLAQVGWALYHTHLANLCQVTSTSGGAEARASAYSKPPKA